MKKLYICIIGILAVCSLCFGAFYLGTRVSSSNVPKDEKVNYVEYGSDFSDIELYSYSGEKGTIPKNTEGYQMVFYLDTRCSSCMDQLTAIKHLEGIFKDNLVSIKIVWAGDFDIKNIEKLGLNKNNNFYLKESKLNADTPSCYILDNNNRIIFQTIETKRAVEKITQLADVGQELVIEKSNNYFWEMSDKQKPLIVRFLMEGCKDCENAENLLKNTNISQEFNIYDVYSKESYGSKPVVDIGEVFLKIYNLDWYPSFLIIENNKYKIIGNIPSQNLEKEIFQKF